MSKLEYIISPMKVGDIESVVQLERQIFKNPWDLSAYEQDLVNNPCSYLYVLKYGDILIGYIDFWITFDSATLCKIGIDPKYQGRHLSSLLMDKMIDELRFQKIKYITLEVRSSNQKAIALYNKYGFYFETLKKQYYADGEDALYLVKEVKQ